MLERAHDLTSVNPSKSRSRDSACSSGVSFTLAIVVGSGGVLGTQTTFRRTAAFLVREQEQARLLGPGGFPV